MSISPVNGVIGLGGTLPVNPAGGGKGFAQMLQGRVADVNSQQLEADHAIQDLVTGETENVHDVVLSVVKADLSFRLMLEIRNRLMENYQEIMRMQV